MKMKMQGQGDDLLPPLKRAKPTLDDSNDVRFNRERPPADYLLRIESFSVMKRSLQVQNKDAFESTEFVAQGSTWVLSIYPNGNDIDDSKEHLSFYLKLVNADVGGLFVTCTFKFFVYNHKHDNYFVVQNIHEKTFHALKNEWGISRVMKLATFTDASQGFLRDDCCIFGVEISVIQFRVTKTASLSLKKIDDQNSYTWKIDKFSELKSKKRRIDSPEFIIGGYSWKLCIYPKGDLSQKGDNLSLFLNLHNKLQLARGDKLLAEFELCLKDRHKYSTDYKKKTASGAWFSLSDVTWGFSKFHSLNALHSSSKSLIRDDVLIAEVNIISLLLLSDSKSLSRRL